VTGAIGCNFMRIPFFGFRGCVTLIATMLCQPVTTCSAYNQDSHKLLVDYVWQVMLAVDSLGRGITPLYLRPPCGCPLSAPGSV
jgi:hypothetical protein